MIARKVSFAFFSNIIAGALGYVSLFFVARLMGPEALGTIAFAFAYIGIFQSFSDLGFGTAHIKRVSEGKNLGVCNGTYFGATMILTFVMVAIVIISFTVTKMVGLSGFVGRDHELVLYLLLLYTVIGNASMMINITFGARKETAKQNIPLLIGKVVEVFGKVTVAVLGLGVIMLAGASLLSAVVVLFCYIYLFRGYPVAKPTREYVRSYTKFALPVVLIAFMTDITHNMDKVMIQFFWKTSDVGLYSAAQQISYAISYITIVSGTLLFPTISAYHAQNKIGAIRVLSRRAERYLSMVFSPVVAFVIVFAGLVCTTILGTNFAQAAPILTILVAIIFVNGTTIPYTQQIGGTNRIALAARISITIFVLDTILNFIFIPKEIGGIRMLGLGSMGAAVSTLLSITTGAIIFRIHAYRITGSKPESRVVRHLIASAVMAAVLFGLAHSFELVTPWHLLAVFAIGTVVYVSGLVILKEFGREEANFFAQILNPVQLKRYMTSEINREYADSSD